MMNSIPVRDHLAHAVAAARPTGAPPWDVAGIRPALVEASKRHSIPDVARAALIAAANPRNRTPAVIGLDGPHWHPAGSDAAPTVSAYGAAAPEQLPPHDPDAARTGAAAVRAALAAARTAQPTTPEGVR